MKNKKGNVLGVFAVIGIFLMIGLVGLASWRMGAFSPQEAVGESEDLKQEVAITKAGEIATIGVYVEDESQLDVTTKATVATYCVDDSGVMVIDGTTSSATAEITGKTAIGKTISCYAFSSTYQTLEPTVFTVDEEWEHVKVKVIKLSTSATGNFYDDTLTTDLNLSVPASNSATYDKLRIKNTATVGNGYVIVGGVYLALEADPDVTDIDFTGSAVVSGIDGNPSANIVNSDLNTEVSARKASWDEVFEIDDDANLAGNQPIVLEASDYLDTGAVTVTADADGCSTAEAVTANLFMKGYYKKTLGTGIGYGHENDATSATVIGADIALDTFYCT